MAGQRGHDHKTPERCGIGSRSCSCSPSLRLSSWAAGFSRRSCPRRRLTRVLLRADRVDHRDAVRSRDPAPDPLPVRRELRRLFRLLGEPCYWRLVLSRRADEAMDPVPHRPVRPLGHLHSDLRLFSDVAGPRNRDPGAGHCRAAPATHRSPLQPGILAVVFHPFLVVAQFAMILVFSRGGTDILSPEEVKTRFTDVWGQDHVLNLDQGEHRLPRAAGRDRGEGRLYPRRDAALGATGDGENAHRRVDRRRDRASRTCSSTRVPSSTCSWASASSR